MIATRPGKPADMKNPQQIPRQEDINRLLIDAEETNHIVHFY